MAAYRTKSDRPIRRSGRGALLVAVALGWFLGMTPGPAISPAAAGPRDPAYNADLIRMSEILGAVHLLRQLCSSGEGQLWRSKMEELLEIEKPEEEQRKLMISHFNISYHQHRRAFEKCDRLATSAADKLIEEGATLSKRLARTLR